MPAAVIRSDLSFSNYHRWYKSLRLCSQRMIEVVVHSKLATQVTESKSIKRNRKEKTFRTAESVGQQ